MLWRVMILALACACSGARAQIANPDFSSGSISPWMITPTLWGQTRLQAVGTVDMDGPGPRESGFAAILGVGQRASGTGAQGVLIWQQVQVPAPGRYRLGALWAVQAITPANASSGGLFELVVNGIVVAQAIAPGTTGAGFWWGEVAGEFDLENAGLVQIGVRVTRAAPQSESVFQYLDDIMLTGGCLADFNNSGGTPDDADVAAFFDAWNEGLGTADVNNSGGTPDDADVAYFYERWGAGC